MKYYKLKHIVCNNSYLDLPSLTNYNKRKEIAIHCRMGYVILESMT